MPEETATAAKAGEDTSNLGKQDEGANDGTSKVDKGEGKKDKSFSQDEVNAIVQKRLGDAKKKADEERDLTETQRLQKERDELQGKLHERDARDSFTAQAEKAGCTRPSALFKLIRDDLEIKDGKVTNAKEALETAREDYPEWFGDKPVKGKGSADGGKGKGAQKEGGSMNDFIRGAVRKSN